MSIYEYNTPLKLKIKGMPEVCSNFLELATNQLTRVKNNGINGLTGIG